MKGGTDRGVARARLLPLLAALGLVVLVCALYAPVRDYPTIALDDRGYVTDNSMVRPGLTREGLAWAFTSVGYMGNWHPMTWISHMLDVTLFGMAPRRHHLVNAGLHAANAVLLLFALRAMTGALWPAVLVAALFAAHPLRVESVAWISERKDVLSACFGFATLWAWVGYARRPTLPRYSAAALLLALGLMSKPMLVTIPLLLLVLDWWPLGRWHPVLKGGPGRLPRLLAEKVPLLALAAGTVLLTLLAQQRAGAVNLMDEGHRTLRLANALLAYPRYLGKLLWPRDLSVYYPYPVEVPPAWQLGGTALLLAGAVAAGYFLRRRAPWVAVGSIWYGVMLVPVTGIVKVGASAIADRYSYLPHVGIVLLFVWSLRGGWRATARPPVRAGIAVASCVLVALGAVETRRQLGFWRSTDVLFSRAVEIFPGDPGLRANAEFNAAVELASRGDIAADKARYEAILLKHPEHAGARNNLAAILLQEGRAVEAERHLRQGLSMAPRNTKLLDNLGVALDAQGRHEEAQQQFLASLEANPTGAAAHYNLGQILEWRGSTAAAIREYREAMRLDPEYAVPYDPLGRLMLLQGQTAEAVRLLTRAVKLRPADPQAQLHLGIARERAGDVSGARESYGRSLELAPSLEEARRALARVQARGAP